MTQCHTERPVRAEADTAVRASPIVVHRLATPEDAVAIAALIAQSFLALAAADWDPDARERFLGEAATERLRERIPMAAYAGCATADGELAGFILLPKPSHVGLCFVHPSALNLGVGRGLWERARAALATNFPEVTTVELNATSYSVPFYRKLGFVPISGPFTLRGCRATRMACWLPARGLGCELQSLP